MLTPSKANSFAVNQLQFGSSGAQSTSANSIDTGLNNAMFLFNGAASKSHHHHQAVRHNFYGGNHFETSNSSMAAYLPTNTDLYFQTNSTNQTLATAASSRYIAPAAAAATFTDLLTAKPMHMHSFSTKTQFSIGVNMNVKRKRRFKKPPELRNVLPKNSLMLLHEYRPNVEYRFVCQVNTYIIVHAAYLARLCNY